MGFFIQRNLFQKEEERKALSLTNPKRKKSIPADLQYEEYERRFFSRKTQICVNRREPHMAAA